MKSIVKKEIAGKMLDRLHVKIQSVGKMQSNQKNHNITVLKIHNLELV